MKDLFGKSLGKSLVISITIALALCSIAIGLHGTAGIKAVTPISEKLYDCGNDKEKCVYDTWQEDPNEEGDNTWKTYDGLVEAYPSYHEGVALYTNYVSNKSSMVWFKFYRDMVLGFMIIGAVFGVALHLYFKSAKEEVKPSKKRKSTKKK